MSKTVMADSLTKDVRFFTNHALEEINGKTRKKNSRGRKTRSKRQRGGNSEAQEEKDKYLFDAIEIYDYDNVENALNNGANVNAQNKDGDTPLIRAIELEDIEMVYLLLERPDIDIKLDVDTNKELQLAEDLWENMTPDDQEENGIPYAIEDYIITKKEKKRIQNIVAQTIPKHLERQKDRKELAARLSKKGVGSFGDGRMPLELRYEIGKYLGGGKRKTKKRQRGGNQKEKDKYLFKAIEADDPDKVEKALNNGALVNAQNEDGDTPLIHAINYGYYYMVQLLLDHPDIDIELDVEKNKELRLAEELTPEDEEQNGIPYLIEDYIVTKNKIKEHKYKNIKQISNYKRPNISSLKTMAYHQSPTDVDTIYNLQLLGMNRPYGKLGGKRKTRKAKKINKRFRTSRKKK